MVTLAPDSEALEQGRAAARDRNGRVSMWPTSLVRIGRAAMRRCILVLALGVSAAIAQQAATPEPPREPRALIEAWRLELQQVEAALQRPNLDDRRLIELRGRIEPLAEGADALIGREQPRADDIKARIEQLGAAPDAAKGQTESPEVAKDRAEQQRLFKEADENIRLARALALRIDQVHQSIADRRRANFAREILAQHASIVSPWLWVEVALGLPADLKAFRFLSGQWAEAIANNLDWHEAVMLALLAILAGIVVPRARRWIASGSFGAPVAIDPEAEPARLAKLMFALRKLALGSILPAAALALAYVLLERFGLLPGRGAPVMEALFTGIAFVFFFGGLSSAILAPERPRWRFLELGDHRARALHAANRNIALTIVAGKVIEAIHAAIVASLKLTLVTKGTIAVIAALFVARGLHRAFAGAESDGEAPVGSAFLPARLLGWSAVSAAIVSAALGYIPLASFLVGQMLWVIIIGMVAVLALALIDEGIGNGLSSKGLLGRRMREATGMTASSIDQLSVLGSGLARLLLFTVLALIVVAPWGVETANVAQTLRAAFFGFQVGGVTISFSTIVVAMILFALGLFITRAIRSWLETRYLPKTSLDPGLRNSISTIFGYVGVAIAAGIALSQLGLGLEKLAIVAGALSVGIGFGLRSIVENFVSGLILLWERPIRVGDWIVVGDEQGTVRRINVRATEIETFDKASLIVPNAEFISGRVKNWVHSDRSARIIIPVSVEYTADPEDVQKLLREAALAHREVMSEPKPIVVFKNFGESGLDFELRCFVDVDALLVTRSELLFEIFRRLREAKIAIPYPTRRVEITQMPADLDPALAKALANPAG